MALIQVNVPDDVKARADAAFARNGITTPDMLLAEAQEYGLIADDATDARTIPDDVLGELGLTAQEVGQ